MISSHIYVTTDAAWRVKILTI